MAEIAPRASSMVQKNYLNASVCASITVLTIALPSCQLFQRAAAQLESVKLTCPFFQTFFIMKSILKLCTQVLGYISIYTFHFNPHWSQFGHTASLKNDKLTYSQNGAFTSKIFFDKKNRFRSLGIRIGTQTL